jgi:hypothetical protein
VVQARSARSRAWTPPGFSLHLEMTRDLHCDATTDQLPTWLRTRVRAPPGVFASGPTRNWKIDLPGTRWRSYWRWAARPGSAWCFRAPEGDLRMDAEVPLAFLLAPSLPPLVPGPSRAR